MNIDLLEEAKKLPFAEKMQLVEDLWDAIAEEAANRPLTSAQKRLLDERVRESRDHPEAARPWEEVLTEIERSL